MIEVVKDRPPWSYRRWIWTLLILCAGQFLLLRHYSQPLPVRPHAPPSTPQRLLSKAEYASTNLSWLQYINPMLFSHADSRNFSGSAWLNGATADHPWYEWKETTTGPGLNPAAIGLASDGFLHDLGQGITTVSAKPTPPFAALSVPISSVVTQSMVTLTGPLLQRGLITPPVMPGCTNAETAGQTLLELAVAPSGYVHSLRLLVSCGQPMADQLALAQAQQLRFTPMLPPHAPSPSPAYPLMWGCLAVHWVTLPPETTNGASSKPQ